jgi:hypothetical protein
MALRWLAIGILGFMIGAAVMVFTDGGDDSASAKTQASVAVAASGDEATTAASAGSGLVHDHTGDVVTGVKALDIQAELQPDEPLDRLTRAQLALQLAAARDEAMEYPTVADAMASGMRVAGGFAPGSGAHYINYSGAVLPDGSFDVSKITSYIYDGVSPDSQIVGLMYYSNANHEGFAGPNDHWHRHSNVCVKFGGEGIEVPFPADADVTEKQCSKAGANLMPITGYMVHAWVVPGWESPQGVFSHENLNIRCADGTYDTDKAGFCQGS